MHVDILYFASLRERLGVERERLELAGGVTDGFRAPDGGFATSDGSIAPN